MASHSRWTRRTVVGALVLALAIAAAAAAAVAVAEHAGPQGDGTAITPVGWRVTPTGQQLQLGERPYGLALSPDGKTALVSNDGVAHQSLMVVDTASGAVTQTIPYEWPQALFLGIAFSPDGTRAYASAGSNNLIRTYTVSGGHLTEGAPIPLATTDAGGNTISPFPAGLTVSADGKALYVADNLSNALSIVDLPAGTETRVPLSTTTCTIGDWGDTSNGTACLFPYTVALSRDGSRAYVSNWGRKTVAVVDTTSRKLVGDVTVGTHPSALTTSPVREEVYVANTDSDSVSVIDTRTNSVTGTISLQPYEHAPVGTNPNALTVSRDGSSLYVANAGDNDVAVVSLGSPSRVQGSIPVGWYPTGIAVSPAGDRLYVENAKGLGAGPNPTGPDTVGSYIGSMIKGSLSTIDMPSAAALAQATKQVAENNGFLQGGGVGDDRRQHALPRRPGEPTPIKHVIYIINENRTYDQVLGDLGRGNGDPSLTLFDRKVAPNHHKLAEQFTTLDNLYAAGEVSDDGWEWSTGANANTLTQKTMPTNYGGRGWFYAGEGGTLGAAPGANPENSYLWDRLDAKGVSYRNYGWWATDVPPVTVYNEPSLFAHTDRAYAGYNLSIPDQDRYAEWKREFDGYVARGDLPTVEFLKFPRDHTAGTRPGAPTPKAMVADSDWATGEVVDAVSHSPYWKSSVILVIEDDAQNGPDHVDAHRTVGHVISPYTQTGKVDSVFYSSVSLLRTIELLVGLQPLTQFDGSANPLYGSFTDRPDFTPFNALKPEQPLDELNVANAPLAAASMAMDLSQEDRAPEAVLNAAIWKSVKGADSKPPAPRHGAVDDDD
jgi:YVTN family beta-propeller protein